MGTLYYLYEDKQGKYQVHTENDIYTYSSMKAHFEAEGEKLHGCFGRIEFAEIWRDFYNGDITRKQLRKNLNL